MSHNNNEAMYALGRQAHAAGFKTIHCNVRDPVAAGWWRGGWHDASIEAGECLYFDGDRKIIIKKC
jgi:hypothetical protein